MRYVDGSVLPVPKKKLQAYWRMARTAGKVWREHGALEYIEGVADDVKPGKHTSFPQSAKLKPGETVAFAYTLRRQADVLGRVQGPGRRLTARSDEWFFAGATDSSNIRRCDEIHLPWIHGSEQVRNHG